MTKRQIFLCNNNLDQKNKVLEIYLDLLKNKNISPSNILLLSINNQKIYDKLLPNILEFVNTGFEEIWIDNFSSFSRKILRKYYYLLNIPKDFEVISGFEQKLLLKRIFEKEDFFNFKNFQNLEERKKIIFNKLKDSDIFINDILNLLDLFKLNYDSENSRLNEIIQKICIQSENILSFSHFYTIYEVYQKYLKIYNFLDYKDLNLKTIELFQKNQQILEHYQNKFHYVILEEMEELTELDAKLLEILFSKCEKNRDLNFFGTANFDSSIYSFKGTDKKFGEKLIEKLNLEKNFLCKDISYNSEKNLIFNCFDREENEIFWIAKKIQEFLLSNKGYEPKDFLIVRRDLKNSAKIYRKIFKEMEIPFYLEGMSGVFDDPLILNLILYVKILYKFCDENATALKNDFDFESFYEDFIKILFINLKNLQTKDKKLFIEFFEFKNIFFKNIFSEKNKQKNISILDFKNYITEFCENSQNFENNIYVFIKKFLEILADYEKNQNINVKNLFFNICNKYELLDYKNEKWEIFNTFFKTISDFEKIFVNLYSDKKDKNILNLDCFINFLDDILKAYTFEATIENNYENVVNIITLANAKMFVGEKKIVFFVGVSENIIPQKFKKFKSNFLDFDNLYKLEKDFRDFDVDINFNIFRDYFSFFENEKVLFNTAISLAIEKCFISHSDFTFSSSDSKLNKSSFLDLEDNYNQNRELFYNKKDFYYKEYLNNFGINEEEFENYKKNKIKIFEQKERNLKYVLKNNKYSKTSVENYLECNKKFLLSDLLFFRLENKDISIYFGNIIHDILYNFHKIYNHSTDFASSVARDFLTKLINEKFDSKDKNILEKFDCIGEIEWYKKFAFKFLFDYLDDSLTYSERKIVFLEESFEEQINNFNLKGRIDRIDNLKNGDFEIIDYKTGHHEKLGEKTILDAIIDLKDLQFLFYYLLLKNQKKINLNENSISNLKFSYIWLKKETSKNTAIKNNKSYKKFGIDLFETIGALETMEDAGKKLFDILDKILEDKFVKIKNNQNSCRNCDFKFVCKK